MDAIAITLNGSPVSGRPGMTILDLAREVGIKIPTLCHDPSLKPAGVCRICLVEEEKSARLLASCITPISTGMVINTESPAVIENRKVIVKLMLASHPESCVLCEKGNRCHLRSLAAELGIGRVDYYPMPKFSGTQEVNPFILRDLSKCVLCGKCIRADQELVVTGALDYLGRGFQAAPATVFNGPLETSECTFCGTCLTMCPTGALFEKGKPHLGTPAARVSSLCSYCGCGCNIFIETVDNKIVSVAPNPENSPNGRTLCAKGHFGFDYIHHHDRLKKPLIRKEGALQEAEWDEALDFAAKGLMECHSKYGPEALAFLGSSKCTNEENFLFQKIARAVFGTNNIDNGARLHSGASVESLPFGAMTNPLEDIEQSDAIFVFGSNPSASHPVASYAIKRAARFKGIPLVVVDPRKTGLAAIASAWVSIRPGKDASLLNGMAAAILETGSFDNAFVLANCTDLDELKKSVAPFDAKFVETSTGCTADQFTKIVSILKESKSPAIVYGHGVTRQAGASEIIRALVNLTLLKGSIGKQGGGIYPLDKENNGQGAWDMGCSPGRLPGSRRLDDQEAVHRFESSWQKPIPKTPGYSAPEMIQAAEAGNLRAMYVMGENPVRSFPNSPGVEKALGSLEFLIVQDLFLTETANLAHVVFPACSFAEKDGTFTNIERRVQRIRKAMEPLAQSRADFEVLHGLAERLGYPMEYDSVSKVTEEIASAIPGYAIHTAQRLSISDWGNGKVPLTPAAPLVTTEIKDGGFILLRGSSLFQFMGGTRTSRSSRLGSMKSAEGIEMNPSDALRLGVDEGEKVKISNGGSDVVTAVSLSDSLPKGILFCHYHDLAFSALFSLDPKSGGSASCTVRVEKES